MSRQALPRNRQEIRQQHQPEDTRQALALDFVRNVSRQKTRASTRRASSRRVGYSMGVARFKVFPGHDAAEQAAHLAKGYAMEVFSYEEIDEETDRWGVTTKVYELRGLKRSECEALTLSPYTVRVVEALASGDLAAAHQAWCDLSVEVNPRCCEKGTGRGKAQPLGTRLKII